MCRYSELFQCHSKLLDYGAGYLGLRLYEDITRPELGTLSFILAAPGARTTNPARLWEGEALNIGPGL